MTTKLILIDHLGKSYLVPHGKVTLNTYRSLRASTLQVCAVSRAFFPSNGNKVLFVVDGVTVFDGFVFSVNSQYDTVSFYAYDRLKYLMYKESFAFYDTSADSIIGAIIKKTGFNFSIADKTNTYIRELIADNQPMLTIIENSLKSTYGRYFLYDDCGILRLQSCINSLLPHGLSDSSNILEYSKNSTIDQNTYNVVKLEQTDKYGIRHTTTLRDQSSINQYGVLQYSKSVDRNMVSAQVQSQANKLLNGNASAELLVTAIGDMAFRAGFMTTVTLKDSTNKLVIDEAQHILDEGRHIMTLKLIS